ncbi:MAG: hypothetical protein M1820_003716 [Bogoriella megaspora]|nr:MAG: hypothetical protein M1820_003716 [Bogoriella megaspora]
MNIHKPSQGIVLPFRKAKEAEANPVRRLRGLDWMPNRARNEFIAMAGEFVGTFLFLFFAFSATQVANAGAAAASSSPSPPPNASVLLYIALAFGFSLAVNAWVFFRISGGLFNPAVTFGMALIGAVTWLRAGLVFISQMLGAMSAAGVVSAIFPGPLNVKTTLGGGTSIARGLFIEMFLTFELVFTIFMLAAEKHKGTFIAPVGIGLSLFIAELSGVYFTGGSLNPARSFGPCIAVRSFEGYHWLYWVGPMLGSLLAVAFYKFVKVLEYETANPGQDMNAAEAEVFSDEKQPDEEMGGAGYAGNGGITRKDTTGVKFDGDLSDQQRGVIGRGRNSATASAGGADLNRAETRIGRAYDGSFDESLNGNVGQPMPSNRLPQSGTKATTSGTHATNFMGSRPHLEFAPLSDFRSKHIDLECGE